MVSDRPARRSASLGRDRMCAFLGALLALVGLPGCGGEETAPKEGGVSMVLHYPVLLIGQTSLDVRDSAQGLYSIPGASTLNLVERRILDSDGRLFRVVRAVPVAGQRSILWDMGTSRRDSYVVVADAGRPSWSEIQALVIEQLRSPTSIWAGDERALARVRTMRGVPELIEASRESRSWAS
jgi:hypothetical protein